MNGGKFQDIRSLLPGMRTVKTGLAVAISLFVNQRLGLELSFYAVIAVVISMDKSIQLSFNAGKSRLIGTVLGALLGLAAALTGLPGNPVVCGLGIIVLIFLLDRLRLKPAIVVASIVFLALMVGFGQEAPWRYSLLRLLDTLMGIVIAWLVNILILPYDNLPKIRRRLEELRGQLRRDFTMVLTGDCRCDLMPLTRTLAALNAELDIYDRQFSWKTKPLSLTASVRLRRLLDEIVCELTVLNRLRDDRMLTPENARRLTGPAAAELPAAPLPPPEGAIIFNHHLSYYLRLFAVFERRCRQLSIPPAAPGA